MGIELIILYLFSIRHSSNRTKIIIIIIHKLSYRVWLFLIKKKKKSPWTLCSFFFCYFYFVAVSKILLITWLSKSFTMNLKHMLLLNENINRSKIVPSIKAFRHFIFDNTQSFFLMIFFLLVLFINFWNLIMLCTTLKCNSHAFRKLDFRRCVDLQFIYCDEIFVEHHINKVDASNQ